MKLLTGGFLLFLSLTAYGHPNEPRVNWEQGILKNQELSTKEYKDSIIPYDFSPLWIHTEEPSVYGIIGDNYQRIRIKFTSIIKDKNNADTYLIMGKSMVKTHICSFTGIIKITKARIYKHMHWGVDDEYKNKGIKKQGILLAQYHFSEDSTQPHSGTFEGILYSSWYLAKNGTLQYDDIEYYSDGDTNNQFVGTWKGYGNTLKKVCNWGDYRVPQSGDFDNGSGQLGPIDKYLKYGWQSYHDAYSKDDKKALQEEERQWWK